MPDSTTAVDVLCRYLVKPGMEPQFRDLLAAHWGMLRREGLATDEPARVSRATDKAGHVAYIEQFAWASVASVRTAHESAAVMQMWEPMGALCEDMEFWNVEPVTF